MLLYWSWYLTPHPVDVMVRVHLLTAPLLLYRPVAMVHQAGAGGKTMHRYGPMLRGLLRLADEVAACSLGVVPQVVRYSGYLLNP